MRVGLWKKDLKIRVFGMLMLAAGSAVIIYSIFYGSSNMGFWPVYLGMMLITTGLGFLGLGLGSPI